MKNSQKQCEEDFLALILHKIDYLVFGAESGKDLGGKIIHLGDSK